MSGFREHYEKSFRLAVLRVLAEPDLKYKANSAVLHTAAKSLGFEVSRDFVHGQLDWLAEQGLISTEKVTDSVRVATLSRRGLDVAEGNSTHSGVERPSPRL